MPPYGIIRPQWVNSEKSDFLYIVPVLPSILIMTDIGDVCPRVAQHMLYIKQVDSISCQWKNCSKNSGACINDLWHCFLRTWCMYSMIIQHLHPLLRKTSAWSGTSFLTIWVTICLSCTFWFLSSWSLSNSLRPSDAYICIGNLCHHWFR